jgi:hypothetical protein
MRGGFGISISAQLCVLNSSASVHQLMHEHRPLLRVELWIVHSPQLAADHKILPSGVTG